MQFVLAVNIFSLIKNLTLNSINLKIYIMKLTFFSIKIGIGFIFYLLFFFFGFFLKVDAQLYNNGPFLTGTTASNGTISPTGYTWSETQANTGNTTESNTSFGFAAFYNNAATNDFRISDDFTVPAGQTWNISNFAFFCYQTGYAGLIPPIDILRVQIYNGDPAAGGVLVAGNLTTNVYDATTSSEAFAYRISNTIVPTPQVTGTLRKIWKVRANITTTLTAGTYWVVYQGHATNDASFFMVPVTLLGSRGAVTANAKQFTLTTNAWANLLDLGLPATAPDVAQDMSFIINDVVLSTNQFVKSNTFEIYPNPVFNNFEIINNFDSKINSVEILDLLGKVVKSVILKNPEQMIINCSEIKSGNYFVKIISENGTEIKKIVKN